MDTTANFLFPLPFRFDIPTICLSITTWCLRRESSSLKWITRFLRFYPASDLTKVRGTDQLGTKLQLQREMNDYSRKTICLVEFQCSNSSFQSRNPFTRRGGIQCVASLWLAMTQISPRKGKDFFGAGLPFPNGRRTEYDLSHFPVSGSLSLVLNGMEL
jgi:hypothetical protein